MTVHREQSVNREKTNKMQQSDVYYQLLSQHVSDIIMPIFQENKDRVTACGVLLWFCWMWLVAVVGRCVVGCEHCEGYFSTPFVVLRHDGRRDTWLLFCFSVVRT